MVSRGERCARPFTAAGLTSSGRHRADLGGGPVAAAPATAPRLAPLGRGGNGGGPRGAAGGGRSATPRWQRLARGSSQPAEPPAEVCDLCGEPLGEPHRHVLDLDAGELACACRACAVLFDRDAAGGGRYRLVPQRRLPVGELDLDDGEWRALGVPVGLAFFVRSSRADAVIVRYPSPAGPTAAKVDPAVWQRLVARAPVLDGLVPDVEALLVNRLRGRRQHWVVPLDDCYRMVAIVRTHWEGFTGGDPAWAAIDELFADLRRETAKTEEVMARD